MITPEIEKKIEAEFENTMRDNMLKTRVFNIPECIKGPQHRVMWWNDQCNIASSKEAFLTHALPLHKEIQELREALDIITAPFTPLLTMDDLADHNLDVRAKFKLDEVKS